MHKLCSLDVLRNSRRISPHHHQQYRCLYEGLASINCVRDRGLDHAVEREKNLKPLINLKNLIKSEPSKSLPLNLITQEKDSLQIPTRSIEFIRRFPSVFEEFLPGGIAVSPHIKLTTSVIDLDVEEDLVYQSVDYKQDVATRLLKLLMVSRINKIPLEIIESLKWELGLPQDYVNTIVPEFPDYFRVIDGGVLDLVCWNSDLAVSVVEKKKGKGKIEFPMLNSTGFEMDKNYKKWVDEWQKLPYVSPYENAQHLASKSDESDKWSVGVLHEVMNLFVGKKAEWDNVLRLGECLGIRPRLKLSLLQHPGIFYLTSKIGTQMVVLKDAYKRGILIERNPLREMRHKYVKLMIIDKKKQDSTSEQPKSNKDYVKKDREDGNREGLNKKHDHEEDDDKDYNKFQKDARNSSGRLNWTKDVPRKRERRERRRGGSNDEDDGKEYNKFQNDTRNSNGRLARSRTKDVPHGREQRDPRRTRGSKDEDDGRDYNKFQKDTRNVPRSRTWTRTRDVPRERELREPQRMRGSRDEDNSTRRIRLKTETPASKGFKGKPRITDERKGFST